MLIILTKIQAFELFAMHCGIGWEIRQKKIPQEKWLCRKYNKLIVSLESPHRPECICFFLNAILSIDYMWSKNLEKETWIFRGFSVEIRNFLGILGDYGKYDCKSTSCKNYWHHSTGMVQFSYERFHLYDFSYFPFFRKSVEIKGWCLRIMVRKSLPLQFL